jgi:PAS domain S-box-containing protein
MSAVAPTERSLADLLLKDRTLPTVAHLLAVAIVFLLVRDTLPNQVFIPWAAAIGAVVAARAIVWKRLAARASPPSVVGPTVRATVGALGLAWGLGAGVAVQVLPPATQAFLLLILAGLLSGSGVALTADRWVLMVYAICMFAPTLIGVALVARDNTGVVVILLILIFVGFTVRLHARAYAMLLQHLQTERQLAAAQEIANMGSWEWDIETNTVTWSDQMRLIFGLPMDAPASFAGYLDRLHPDDRSRIQATIAASVAERRPMNYDWRTIRPDGEERLIHTRNMLVTDASGRVVRMLGIALDITERTRAEENQRTLLRELQASVTEVKVLKGILPICASCKRIKNDDGGWQAVESFVRERTDAEFSHGLCPDCATRDWGAPPRSA